jgi:hypothetical protein
LSAIDEQDLTVISTEFEAAAADLRVLLVDTGVAA